MTRNPGSHVTAPRPGKPPLPQVLAGTLCLLALVPAVLAGAFAVWSVVSAASDAGSTWGSVLVVALYMAGLLAFFMMRRSVTARRTWITAGLTITLVLAASAPVVWVVSHALLEEWCETQPGGRGGPDITSMDEVPAVCR